MKQNAYIAGCGGMLGQAFWKVWGKNFKITATDKDVNEDWLKYLDFRNYAEYEKQVRSAKPDVLIHLGALTDLEYCEQHPEETYETNTLAVENAVKIANIFHVPLIYISTAGIYDGKQSVYDDWDVPNPLGVYGRSKYLGERFVIENSHDYYIFRAGWMMGGGKKDKKFIKLMHDQIASGATTLHVVNDKDGTPTYTHDFAKNALKVFNSKFQGLYNMVCGGETSRLEVAKFMVQHLNLQDKIKIIKVRSDYFPQYWATRPPSERLVNKKLNLRNLNIMRPWQKGLAEYLDSGELNG